uniref:AAA+ ATPase domain-containing protein n=1 Tax=Eptatretus burgeri TaxID=7764 RepID=A0A8C4NKT0_EPTBU
MHLCTHGYLIFDVDFCNWISFAVNTLFDYHFDSKKKSWIPWQRMVLPYIHNPEMRFNNIQVPTVESTRMGWLLQHLMAQRQPALLVGDTGTSKTTMVQSFLQGQDPDCTMQLSVTFSSRTTSMDVQRNLEASVEKRIKSVYGPPLGKILFVFLDDLNMPQVDNYGTQQPIALLKLLLEGGFMYNRGGKPGRKDLHDLHFLAAMGTTGGARHKVDSRFLSLFSIIHVPFPCAESLLSIYTSMLSGHLEVFELPLSRGYCERVFREDLKKLYLQLGVDNKPTVFLINDSFIIEEGFLEHVNNMLTTGNVPALFSEEELEIALNELREEAGDAGVGVRKKEVWQFFMRRCRDNLHVVFTTSPAGDLLRLRCRSFPGLVNNTGIDWFLPWPHEALLQVAQSFLGDSGMVQEDLMPEVVQHAAMVYHCVEQNSLLFEQQLHRFNHVTPQNYLDCLNTYLHLLQEKNQLIQGQCTRLEGGLRKLQEASEELNELSEKLDEQKHELAEKAKACRTLLEEIAINKETVDAKTALARRKAQEMEEQNGVIAMEKHAAEKALSVALPALVTARLALQNFEKSDVTEIRSFAKPPRQVQMICESIMVIRGYREVNWKAAKAMMAEPNFLRLLVDMDCDSITQNQVKVVKGVLDKLGTTAKDMASISKAGAGMLRFVEAVVAYCDLSKEIKPKRDKMAWLEREYKRSGQQLESIQITVDMLQTEQDRMGDRYEIALKEEVRLKEETQLMETRLDAAEKLFSGLSSENARWHKELEEQCTRQRLLVGNCLLTAAFIAYQGPFTWEFRSKMSREWENDAESRRIPFSQPFQPETLLSDNVETARFGIKFLTSAIFEDGWRLLFSPLSVCLFVCLC